MKYIEKKKNYRVKHFYLQDFLEKYWFIPSDVLQRSIEANVWDLCKLKPPILDIGIGNGQISTIIFKNHPQIDVGIDINKNGLEDARATKKYKEVLWADAEKMPFNTASFNTVVSNSTFEHIFHDVTAVAEVGRILKKQGYFYLTVPSHFLPQWIFSYEQKINKNKARGKLNSFDKRVGHLHYRSLKEWEHIFQKNNMSIVFYKYYFPYESALFWYRLFQVFTFKLNNRELWSYLGQSKISSIIPRKMIINLLEKRILKKYYENAFFTANDIGGQLFMVAQKTKS